MLVSEIQQEIYKAASASSDVVNIIPVLAWTGVGGIGELLCFVQPWKLLQCSRMIAMGGDSGVANDVIKSSYQWLGVKSVARDHTNNRRLCS